MSNEVYISQLHNDHKLWLSELILAQDQLKSFGTRLMEVNAANTGTEVRTQVEHFQNRFIREKEVTDILLHDIRKEEQTLTASVASNNVAVEHRKVADNESLRDRMLTFNNLFTELRNEFSTFLSKVL